MATQVKMPQLGLTMTEGVVVQWLKRPGDAVKAGEAIARIETDKLTSDLESPEDGVVLALHAEEGDTIPVLGLLATVGAAGEKAEAAGTTASGGSAAAQAPGSAGADQQRAAAQAGGPAPGGAGPVSSAATPGGGAARGGRVVASPLAKKTAAKLGVDLAALSGTGPGGRIVQKDVLEAQSSGASAKSTGAAQATGVAQAASPAPGAGASARPGDSTRPLSGMRKVIGRRMTDSKREAPHVTLVTEARVDALVAFRERLNAKSDGVRISYTDIIVKASAVALRKHPALNSSISGDTAILRDRVNVGVATSLDDGLLVPVLRDVDRKGLSAIAAESKDLAARARSNALAMDELEGGTFTVSNLGTYEVDAFTPIINLPEVAILGVGRIVVKPAFDASGAVVPASMMTLSLSFDHRAVDGAGAAEFLRTIKGCLEDPDRLSL